MITKGQKGQQGLQRQDLQVDFNNYRTTLSLKYYVRHELVLYYKGLMATNPPRYHLNYTLIVIYSDDRGVGGIKHYYLYLRY